MFQRKLFAVVRLELLLGFSGLLSLGGQRPELYVPTTALTKPA